MKKDEFIKAVSQKSQMNQSDVLKALDATIETITELLANKDTMNFKDFGTFKLNHRKARDGRNPSTGAPLKIAACNVVAFTASKNLKGKVNQ